mmetsp:Transcript_45631/g.90532  ORF Transcript_45631/g.90532 Transcript_45631/m.90532 type:complete len:209 (+) Transcript_45631:116-742(+)
MPHLNVATTRTASLALGRHHGYLVLHAAGALGMRDATTMAISLITHAMCGRTLWNQQNVENHQCRSHSCIAVNSWTASLALQLRHGCQAVSAAGAPRTVDVMTKVMLCGTTATSGKTLRIRNSVGHSLRRPFFHRSRNQPQRRMRSLTAFSGLFSSTCKSLMWTRLSVQKMLGGRRFSCDILDKMLTHTSGGVQHFISAARYRRSAIL